MPGVEPGDQPRASQLCPLDDQEDTPEVPTYTRREALAAMAKYSAVVGGTAATIVTAEGLVSAASAYPPWLANFCRRYPQARICTWDGWDDWGTFNNGRGRGNGNGRIRF